MAVQRILERTEHDRVDEKTKSGEDAALYRRRARRRHSRYRKGESVRPTHRAGGVNPLTMLYFLRRAAKLAERFSGDSLTTSHPEAHLGERLDAEISQVRGKASKRRFRFMLRTIIDFTAAKESELLDPNGLALNLEGVEVVTNKGSQRALM